MISASNIKIKRCASGSIYVYNAHTSGLGGGVVTPANVTSLELAQNWLSGHIYAVPSDSRTITNVLVENNRIGGVLYFHAYGVSNASVNNIIVRNNFIQATIGLENGIFENNILYSNNGLLDAIYSGNYALNCTVNNNVSKYDILPAGNGNQSNLINLDLEFTNVGSDDAKYRLKNNSALKTAGNGGGWWATTGCWHRAHDARADFRG